MNLYLLEQDVINEHDTYYACIVAANTEEEAKIKSLDLDEDFAYQWIGSHDISVIKVTYIGIADPKYTEPTIILSADTGS